MLHRGNNAQSVLLHAVVKKQERRVYIYVLMYTHIDMEVIYLWVYPNIKKHVSNNF